MQDKYSENSDPIEDLFRKGFDSHKESPPEEVWENIAAFLDATKKGAGSEGTFLTRHWGKMLSCLGLFSSVVLWLMLTSKEEVQPLPVDNEKKRDTSFAAPSLPVMVKGEEASKSKEKKGAVTVKAKGAKTKIMDSVFTENQLKKEEEKPIIIPSPTPESDKNVQEQVKEEEPSNLYDQMKKEKKESKQLFIEKKK